MLRTPPPERGGTGGGPHRVAIVGTGGIAHTHAAALRELGDRVRLVAAIDVDTPLARQFAQRCGIADTYASLADTLAHAPPDVVHICTPPRSHAALAAACLRAGVVPVIEKPPTMSLTELDELVALERESGVRAACVFQHRFGSAAARLRDLVAAGALGRPLVAAANTYWFRDDAYFAVPWRGSWQMEGGGPTMGHGIHQFDLLLSVLGGWSEVTAIVGTLARPTETEDVSMALVRFDNGAMATVANSVVSPRETSYVRVDFERATVEVEHLYGYDDTDWTLTPAPGHRVPPQWDSGGEGNASGHAAQFRAVYDALDAGAPPPVTLAEARLTMELVAAIYASAFTRRPVRRGELGTTSPFSVHMGGRPQDRHPEVAAA